MSAKMTGNKTSRRSLFFIKRRILVCGLAVTFFMVSIALTAQNQQGMTQQAARRAPGGVMVDEVERETIVEIRSPEGGVLPRRETEEVKFALNFIRDNFIESNKKLY